MRPRTRNLKFPVLALVAGLTLAASAFGIQPPEDSEVPKSGLEFAATGLKVEPSLYVVEPGSSKAFANSELQAFFAKHSREWKVTYDGRSDLPHLIQGKGIALIPGRGNDLGRGHLKLGYRGELELRDVAGLLEGFMKANAGLLGTAGKELALDLQRSHAYGEKNHYWSVVFKQMHQGLTVEGAYYFFRVSHGNVIQFGSHRVAPVHLDATPAITDADAFQMAAAKLGVTETVDRGALKVVPFLAGGDALGEL